MADNSPPPQVRALLRGEGGGRLKILHPQNFAGAARLPRNAEGGGGLGGAFGGGGAQRGGFTPGTSGDPAVTGDFQHRPVNTFYGFPIAGGGLTDKGKSDKEDFDTLKAGRVAYATARFQGASDEEATHAAIKAGGIPLLVAMSGHPDNPMASLPAFHAFLSGQSEGPAGPVFGAVDKSGRQVSYDPNTGEALGAKQVPGLGPTQPAYDPKRMVRTDKGLGYVQDDGTIKPMNWSNSAPIPNGGGVITSAGGPSGQVGMPLTAAQAKAAAAANQPVTQYSKDPLPSPDAKHPLTNAQVSYLSNAPNFINDLKVARDYANTAGPVSGMVNYVGGKYLGLNAEGATYAAALNRLDQGVYAQYGVKGSAGAKQLMATLPTHNQAPSYVQSAITGQIENATRELQNQADLIEKQSGPLPGTVTSQLAGKVDVFPLSTQNNASPSWVARNYPDQLTGPMATSLAHRTDLEPSEVQGLNKQLDTISARRAQDAQTAQQSAAAQAAAVRNRPSSMTPTPTAPEAAPGEQPAAQPVGQAPGTAGAPTAGPSAAPPLSPGQQDQSSQQTQQTQQPQLAPSVAPPMPNSSATPAATPAPPSASAPLPPLSPDTLNTLRQGGVPTDAITNQQGPAAPQPPAPQSEAAPAAPAAVNPYAAAAIAALGGGT